MYAGCRTPTPPTLGYIEQMRYITSATYIRFLSVICCPIWILFFSRSKASLASFSSLSFLLSLILSSNSLFCKTYRYYAFFSVISKFYLFQSKFYNNITSTISHLQKKGELKGSILKVDCTCIISLIACVQKNCITYNQEYKRLHNQCYNIHETKNQ